MSGLELRGVVKRFGDVVVVKQLNLKVAEGEFLVLLGESGCGKSTTLRMIAGLEEVTEGRVFIGGRDVTDTHPMDRDIAMVFQNYALYPHMDVAKNMSFSLRISGVAPAVVAERVAAAAKILNIEHILARKPKDLSGGQRQRVAIGRAIVREPKVFLFDEPLSNLDAKLRSHMRAELAVLHQRLGKTTIYVTHDQVEAMTLATRIVVFDKGQIQQVGTPAEVFNNPANTFVAGFIGTPSMNMFEVVAQLRNGELRLVGDGIDWAAPQWLGAVGVKDAQPLTLGLRPQSLSAGEALENRFTLRADVVEYLGTESQVVGVTQTKDERRISVIVPGDARAMHRQHVSFCFDPSALHVFDKGSGASLRPTINDTLT
ncbi:MAG: ABC transporter ATP-binding protein [Burkholderiales bacterium]|nr:MAG: ABC transporter ATP-binding protein [Betaproteobacteria bacterium]TAG28602.1 MAG: ABC transporter ATP-binding protein [Burkholderiales bacterium]